MSVAKISMSVCSVLSTVGITVIAISIAMSAMSECGVSNTMREAVIAIGIAVVSVCVTMITTVGVAMFAMNIIGVVNTVGNTVITVGVTMIAKCGSVAKTMGVIVFLDVVCLSCCYDNSGNKRTIHSDLFVRKLKLLLINSFEIGGTIIIFRWEIAAAHEKKMCHYNHFHSRKSLIHKCWNTSERNLDYDCCLCGASLRLIRVQSQTSFRTLMTIYAKFSVIMARIFV